MKNRKILSKILMTAIFTIIALTISAANSFAQNSPKEDDSAAAQSGGAALGTGVFSLLPGQTVRVSAVNVGSKAIPLEIIYVPVSEQGKAGVQILCNLFPAPGDAALDAYTHPGGVNRILMYVQIRVRQNPNDIKELIPSLEIINTENGKVANLLSGKDFVSLRPIYIPPRPEFEK